MNCAACLDQLDDFLDDQLAPAKRRELEAHLTQCARCRAERDTLHNLLANARELPREITPPRDLWLEIAGQLSPDAARPERDRSSTSPRGFAESRPNPTEKFPTHTSRRAIPPRIFAWFAPLATAAAIVGVATTAERHLRQDTPGWAVAATAGAPRIGTRTVQQEATFRVGEWLETDAASRARVDVGTIGEVNVEPNSRLRLVRMEQNDHRLELARGELSAFIVAPPRLFVVDTPSATAFDLGCAYTLNVDDRGNGELRVSSGYVSLEHGGRASIVRMGMMCLTRRGHGPGTPFVEDAPEPFRDALERLDFEPGSAATALGEVLARARADDSVTLWHLLSRTAGVQRAAVFDALAKLSPPPAAVTRAGILAGSAAMLRAWASDLGLDRL